MEIEEVPIDDLILDPLNARVHSRRNIEAIKASLKQFGQQKPIIALHNGTVLAGNGTIQAARELGWETIHVKRFDDADQARAFAIADNRTAELAEWDEVRLQDSLADLDLSFLNVMDLHESEPQTRDPEELNVEPYKSIHVLVSFDVKQLDKAQALLQLLAKDFPAAEVTSGTN